jgi:hypothetical protein
LENKEQKMPKAVIEDLDQFRTYLSSQPLCMWAAQKQHEIEMGLHSDGRKPSAHPRPPKNDNAELAEALSSMA